MQKMSDLHAFDAAMCPKQGLVRVQWYVGRASRGTGAALVGLIAKASTLPVRVLDDLHELHIRAFAKVSRAPEDLLPL